MKTQAINNQTFEHKKFRKIIRPGGNMFGAELQFKPYVEEYSGPNAKSLYNQMCNEKDVQKRMLLKKELGPAEIKPLNIREKMILFFASILRV